MIIGIHYTCRGSRFSTCPRPLTTVTADMPKAWHLYEDISKMISPTHVYISQSSLVYLQGMVTVLSKVEKPLSY